MSSNKLQGNIFRFNSSNATVAVDYLVVAGGGAGGNNGGVGGGGGGAGGVLSGSTNLNLKTSYTIVVGNGGTGGAYTYFNTNGGDSSLGSIIAHGGGSGGHYYHHMGRPGGCGGGAASNQFRTSHAGKGNAWLYKVSEGNSGGHCEPQAIPCGSGGGGAGVTGYANLRNSNLAGYGGDGIASSITGSSVTYAGGGGGGAYIGGTGGTGGSGGGGTGQTRNGANGTAGTANTGGGGGGSVTVDSYNGGSGIVIVRALQQASSTTGSPTYTTSGSYHIYSFTGSGSITY